MSSHAEHCASQLHILMNRLDYFSGDIKSRYDSSVQSLVANLRKGIEDCAKFLGRRHKIELDVETTFAMFLLNTRTGDRIASCYIDATSPPVLKTTFSGKRLKTVEEVFVLDFARLRRLPEGMVVSTGIAVIDIETWHRRHLDGEIVEDLSDFLLGELVDRGVEILAQELGELFASHSSLQDLIVLAPPEAEA